MDTLKNIWKSLADKGMASDKGDIHSYLDIYSTLLEPYRECKRMLEIGIFRGHSLRMWEYYFYNSDVYGVDCSDTPLDGMADLREMIESGLHRIRIFDATDPVAVKRYFEDKKFDVILDDAGHGVTQNLQLFNAWKPYMNKVGLYIIEDIADIDETRHIYENIAPGQRVEIIDLRERKKRYDDVLALIYF